MSTYIPREYWLKRGKIYRQQFQHDRQRKLQEERLIDYLKTISPFSSVLEVGCGFGRITKLVLQSFPHIKEYVAVDLSPDQIKEAEKYVGNTAGNTHIEFQVSEIQALNADKKYDLVLSCSVLMHILPEEIERIIKKLGEMASKHMVNVDWYEDPIPKQSQDTWNFVHQYESLYHTNASVDKVTRIPIVREGMLGFDTRQSIFHATTK